VVSQMFLSFKNSRRFFDSVAAATFVQDDSGLLWCEF